MIKEDTYSYLDKLKCYTKSNMVKNERGVLPVYNTGNIFTVNQYHFNGKWVSYESSARYPERAFSILYVENMPYKSLYKRQSNSSFIVNLEKMVYDNEIHPFLLFINGRFVPWSVIDIVHDCSNSYIKLYGPQYKQEIIKDIQMIIMPYNIICDGYNENDYRFNNNYDALCKFVNDNAYISASGKLTTSLPNMDTEYVVDNIGYTIGYWMYTQIRLKASNQLSKERIDKLRNIEIKYDTYSGKEVVNSKITTINIFDRDSYDDNIFTSFKNIKRTDILFSFDENGYFSDDGIYKVYSVTPNRIGNYISYHIGNTVIDANAYINNKTLSRNNYIVFRNNMLCTNYKYELAFNNVLKIYDLQNTEQYTLDGNVETTDENTTILYVFYSTRTGDRIIHRSNFRNMGYINEVTNEYLIEGISNKYIEKVYNELDFNIDNLKLYDTNHANMFNDTLNFNPALFNDSYKKKIYSRCMTGKEVNETIVRPLKDGMYGLYIPRMGYDNHKAHMILFVNGEIIDNYCDTIEYTNFFFIPRTVAFHDNDQIEILYFLNVNNNTMEYSYNSETKNYINVIPEEDLKIFSTDVRDLLEYNQFEYDMNEISFPIYKKTNDGKTILMDNSLQNRMVTVVSSKRFVYQRLFIDKKAYRIRISKNFRYCDNQKQFMLFINGRVVPNNSFLITIPKVTRPFNYMYLYSSKFYSPEDRIELFYLPTEMSNINENDTATINENGYITCDQSVLNYPLSNELYLFFVNGKKIPKEDVCNVSTNIVKLIKDPMSTNNLSIVSTSDDYIKEVSDFIQDNTKVSDYEKLINIIIGDEKLGYNELNNLFDNYIRVSNIEPQFSPDVAKIAIINEIVRDFWVMSNFDYSKSTFIYDYELDEYITQDDKGNYILPSMDATQNINIIKSELHFLYFKLQNHNSNDYFEYGYKISNPIVEWEYSDTYGPQEITEQYLNNIVLGSDDRSYQIEGTISNDSEYKLYGTDGYEKCLATLNINFCNAIYYGLIDEDLLDNRQSDIYHSNPSQLLRDITKEVKPTADLSLNNYVIGNNKYFIYAAPKRLVYGENGKPLIKFYLPNINDEYVINSNKDDKTKPIFTNGKYDKETINPNTSEQQFIGNLIELKSFEMEKMIEFTYVNQYRYKETYVIFKSNGYFTRLYDNTKFNIIVK